MLKSDAEDIKGGPFYSRYDRTRVETNWKTTIKKERDAYIAKDFGSPTFQMNFANQAASGGPMGIKHSHNRIEIVAEKVEKQSPQARMNCKGMDPTSMEVRTVKHIERKPTAKWDVPLATSHDIGWMVSNPVRAATLTKFHTPPRPDLNGSMSAMMSSSSTGDLTPERLKTPARSMVVPANEHILSRSWSAGFKLPQGPNPEAIKDINNRRWYRPMRQQDITRYAETYQTVMGSNPFNKADAGR
eukprot:TRINITY_DN5594_c0_g1_i1.p1 TRINITY_DN5594_c0_g1~~TRINITY_DN5594_c0_g1_i1.p1  ORF type:complete len:244 (-),score=64.29 TRINITY_DN5594_c0_g1_i1:71-802(-)